MLPRTVLALALAAGVALPALAADTTHPDLTIYSSDNAALFSAASTGAINAGHAVVHEQRTVPLQAGTHDISIDNLPNFIDSEAVHLRFASGGAQIVSQRLLLPHGPNGSLAMQVGKSVTVFGADGKQLAQGQLIRVNRDGSLVIGGDVFGPTVVRTYAAIKLTGGAVASEGARLDLRVTATRTGSVPATLTYPTGGIGWRAAYTGTIATGQTCSLRLDANASIANRSGRDWTDARIKLVAGSPRFAQAGGIRMTLARSDVPVAQAAMPQQGTLGDYRTYTLDGDVTLPNGSVTLTPIYKPHTVSCERIRLFEHGNTYQPPHPVTSDNGATTQQLPIISMLSFNAFNSLPAGSLRVLTVDANGNAEFIGAGHVGDTPRGQPVYLTLGTAFDLTGTQARTSFTVNQAARTIDEGFHVTLTNAGAIARTITVREHPSRWRVWTLASSSSKPTKQTPDMLEFEIDVPANGSATLDYVVHYTWTAADE